MVQYRNGCVIRISRMNKCSAAIRAVEKSMEEYGITRPSTTEQKKLFKDPYRKEGDPSFL